MNDEEILESLDWHFFTCDSLGQSELIEHQERGRCRRCDEPPATPEQRAAAEAALDALRARLSGVS